MVNTQMPTFIAESSSHLLEGNPAASAVMSGSGLWVSGQYV